VIATEIGCVVIVGALSTVMVAVELSTDPPGLETRTQ
jgi:hypothetical protein